MSKTFEQVIVLVDKNEVRISEHGYDELAQDDLLAREIVAGAKAGIVVEDYPDYHKGPCVLVLQCDSTDRPIHVVWGIPKDRQSPAVVVTAYRPDPERWSDDFLSRKRK